MSTVDERALNIIAKIEQMYEIVNDLAVRNDTVSKIDEVISDLPYDRLNSNDKGISIDSVDLMVALDYMNMVPHEPPLKMLYYPTLNQLITL
ncbi:hypothetical protein ACR9PT_14760 [Piscirickettsia salmonis]|uniref:hypothetical protein n=1 Tax=Piscirickettsia salmonis TaxID=1238 RepID=UPI0012BA72D8|nr:hypothetical protein [Piscirickettsia salmonis]QGP53634.1 hypothetical protein PsalSR1_01048 [Piscirickettsia salmonis]QGP60453.1 hypothetical protein PsalBI1_03068 [Piscirickettsia salmonis]QGP63202.1 hypothetical protein PsalMR5_01049 [Piscirickettsia salmonis]